MYVKKHPKLGHFKNALQFYNCKFPLTLTYEKMLHFLGCTLSAQFRNCVRPITSAAEGSGSCVLSSCIIQAGSGICGQSDVSKAIDTNLGCVFKQVALLNISKRQIHKQKINTNDNTKMVYKTQTNKQKQKSSKRGTKSDSDSEWRSHYELGQKSVRAHCE